MIYFDLKKKMKVYKWFCYFILVAILAKLAYLQLYQFEKINTNAQDSWERSFPLSASRGVIYDRNMNELATNLATMSVFVIPSQIENMEHCSEILAAVLQCDKNYIYTKINKKTSMVKIYPEGKNITEEQASVLAEYNLKGVYLVYDNQRYYPYDELLANTIGFVGIDNQGLAGLESKYDEYLKGKDGSLNYVLDAKGGLLNGYSSNIIAPVNGLSIQLTVDLSIQQIVERELENAYQKYSPESIYALAMNPNNGEILAISNRPTFDLNYYQDYSQEIYNRNLPIWKSYEPGSTFKVFSFAAGLEENKFDMFKDTYYDNGYEYVNGFQIKSWKKGGHGLQTFLEVLENSSNPGFVEISRRLGCETLYQYVKDFGFSKKTNVDLVGESSGIFFSYDRYNELENATTAFGQGISVTAIQMVRAFSSVINGGILYQPKITKSILLGGLNDVLFEYPTIIENEAVISQKTSGLMRYALESVVAKGSGRKAYLEGYKVGGKTGTAQIAENGVYLDGQYILSFICGVPMDDPQIVLYVAMEKPKSTIQYGGTIIGPIIKNMLIDIVDYLGIEKRDDEIEFEYTWMDVKTHLVDDYTNMEVKKVKSPYFQFVKIGNGDIVISQLPKSGEKIEEGKSVILFT